MYRSLVALLAVGLLAAPGPKDKEPVLYHPVQEGVKRVMEMSVKGALAGRTMETVETVTKVERKDGKYLVTVARETPGKAFKAKDLSNVLEVSGQGILRVASFGKDLPDPAVMLRLPATPGDTWKSGGATSTVGKEEEVEVPAGKYKAIPVVAEFESGGKPVKTTAWFAAGVGIVKSVTSVNDIETTYVLKSFTPGK